MWMLPSALGSDLVEKYEKVEDEMKLAACHFLQLEGHKGKRVPKRPMLC